MPDNNFLSVKAGNFFKLLMSIFHYDRHDMTFTAHFLSFWFILYTLNYEKRKILKNWPCTTSVICWLRITFFYWTLQKKRSRIYSSRQKRKV